MYMTKTHSKEMDSYSYRNVHDENPYIRIWIVIKQTYTWRKPIIIWIVIRTNMYMTKIKTKTYVNMDIRSTKLYMTKHTIKLISTRKMMKFHSKWQRSMWHHEWLTCLIKWGTDTIHFHSDEIAKESLINKPKPNTPQSKD